MEGANREILKCLEFSPNKNHGQPIVIVIVIVTVIIKL